MPLAPYPGKGPIELPGEFPLDDERCLILGGCLHKNGHGDLEPIDNRHHAAVLSTATPMYCLWSTRAPTKSQ
jgi:hypothetical protein